MSRIIILSLVAISSCLMAPADAEAGPLIDWFRGLRNRSCCLKPKDTCATSANPMGLQPGQCARTCMKTCTRTVVNYVPQTCYRTAWNRIPVTQYKPVTNTDPCTGCTVTCMKPCTTYSWQMKRVPYTTYRPVYRQESYKVPVTTITNDCATGTCPTDTCSTGTCSTAPAAGCNTCSVPGTSYGATPSAAPAGTYYTNPATGNVLPPGSLSTDSVPADVTPSINVSPQSTQRPSVIDQMQDTSTAWPAPQNNTVQGSFGGAFGESVGTGQQSTIQPVHGTTPPSSSSRPAYINHDDKTAKSPVRERWAYSPVKLVSYTKPTEAQPAQPTEVQGTFIVTPPTREAVNTAPANSGWATVNW